MHAKASIRSGRSLVSSVLLIGLFVAGVAFIPRHPAIANIPVNAPIDGYGGGHADDGDHFDALEMPMPVVGTELFIARSVATTCATREAVIAKFLQDESQIGGRTFTIADGLDQRFADVWRARAGAENIAISGIVTHLFFDRGADEWMADVVEFDKAGCAISRTLLPEHALEALFATLAPQDDKFRAGNEASNVNKLPNIRPRAHAISDR